jgi:hypothetical protein
MYIIYEDSKYAHWHHSEYISASERVGQPSVHQPDASGVSLISQRDSQVAFVGANDAVSRFFPVAIGAAIFYR